LDGSGVNFNKVTGHASHIVQFWEDESKARFSLLVVQKKIRQPAGALISTAPMWQHKVDTEGKA
jgi:hypothetical protein